MDIADYNVESPCERSFRELHHRKRAFLTPLQSVSKYLDHYVGLLLCDLYRSLVVCVDAQGCKRKVVSVDSRI